MRHIGPVHREECTPVPASCLCGHTFDVPYRRARAVDRGERHTACPECRKMLGVTLQWSARVCGRRDCDQPLGRYNPGPDCHACDRRPAASAA